MKELLEAQEETVRDLQRRLQKSPTLPAHEIPDLVEALHLAIGDLATLGVLDEG